MEIPRCRSFASNPFLFGSIHLEESINQRESADFDDRSIVFNLSYCNVDADVLHENPESV